MPIFSLFRLAVTVIGWLVLASVPAFAAGGGAAAYLKKPDAWFATPEAWRTADVILSYQSELGGWPKNTDTVDAPYTGDRKELHPTFDNGATTDELRFLARCIAVSSKEGKEESLTADDTDEEDLENGTNGKKASDDASQKSQSSARIRG